MALEETVLDGENMTNLLKANWDISCASYRKLPIGTANCFTVNDGSNTYFLKEYQSYIEDCDIIREENILEKLKNYEIPSTDFIETVSREKMVKYKGHRFVLQKYMSGQSYGYNDFPEEMLPQMAVMLAKIHIALKDMELPVDMDAAWVNSDAVSKYDNILEVLEQHREDSLYKQIKEDLLYKRTVLQKNQDIFRRYFEGITYSPSHGDYQGCQIIGENNRIKAVIDFTSARKLPVVWELMRSFVQTSHNSRNNAKIDLQDLRNYVKAYCEYFPLSDKDLNAMPYVYVFQLLRSTYGYKEYLLSDSEDREGLISFAFWRTKICKEVLGHIDEIVENMMKIREECDWCSLTDKQKKYLLITTDFWSVYLADEQDYVGRCVLVLKRHCDSLSELTEKEWFDLRYVVRHVESCFKSVLGATMCNWSCLMNSFYKESSPNPHLHLHVRPRFKNPIVINGNQYVDEQFGHHYARNKNSKITLKDRQTIYEWMKNNLKV